MLQRWLAPALGLVLAAASIAVAADAVQRLNVASVLADSGANLPRKIARNAEFNGVYVLGFGAGFATALMAALSSFLLRLAVKAWRRVLVSQQFHSAGRSVELRR